MSKKQIKFDSLEEVREAYPLIYTTVLHTVKPLSRSDASQIHRAQAEARNSFGPMRVIGNHQVVRWMPPTEPSTIDLIELHGVAIKKNGDLCDIQNIGPIFVNYSYDPSREIWHDFVENDTVTFLYKNMFFGQTKKELHAVAAYNHDTNILVQCQDNFACASYETAETKGLQEPAPLQRYAEKAAHAIVFLQDNRKIPKLGQQPRLVDEGNIKFEYFNSAPYVRFFRFLMWTAFIIAFFWVSAIVINKFFWL